MSTTQADDLGIGDEEEMIAVEAHPRAIRWMHWINFPVLSIMIWSGLRIYWSFDFTRVIGEFGDNNLIPNDFYDCLLYTSPSPRDQRGSRMPSSA